MASAPSDSAVKMIPSIVIENLESGDASHCSPPPRTHAGSGE
jgi:hypothetical protein